jgi:ribosome biogenesis GTPase / thiamine phosphate phosphatase
MRGKFKKDYQLKKDKLYLTDIAAVGDYVDFNLNADRSGVIISIDERKNYISRKAPKIKGSGFRGERLEQIAAANIDKLFIISSAALPAFNNKVVDRFIVAAESSNITPIIVINKVDISKEKELSHWLSLYEKIGYTTIASSAVTSEGVSTLKQELIGNKNLFWGQSGVGKSSLLNKLFPELELKTGKISSYNDKGTHTTVTGELIKVEQNTYIIDTPGVREIDPFGIKKEDLGHYFREFIPYGNDCRFNTCTHFHEPGCAIIEAVEKGKISEERYESYLRILATIEDDINF